jgi:hypothetical protein
MRLVNCRSVTVVENQTLQMLRFVVTVEVRLAHLKILILKHLSIKQLSYVMSTVMGQAEILTKG